MIIKAAHPGKMIEKPCTVVLYIFVDRPRDIDGSIKIVLDLLERMRIYKNDSLVDKLIVYKEKDKEFPRIEIEVMGV